MFCAAGSAGTGGGTCTLYMSPGLTLWLASLTVAPAFVTAPAASNCWMRERESWGRAAARKRSSRSPACSAPASAVRFSPGTDESEMTNSVDDDDDDAP